MNKKQIFFFGLSLFLVVSKSEAIRLSEEVLSFDRELQDRANNINLNGRRLVSHLEELYVRRDVDNQEYIGSKIAKGRSYDELLQEANEQKNNYAIAILLFFALIHKTNQEIAQVAQEKGKKRLIKRFETDVAPLLPYFEEPADFSREQYEKEAKPFMCQRLFGNTTEEQIAQEMREASSNLRQTVIFGKATHCGCINDSWESFLAKHNIDPKAD